MKNYLLRKAINALFSMMSAKTRMDIYHKFETVGDLAYKLPNITSASQIRDVSMQ